MNELKNPYGLKNSKTGRLVLSAMFCALTFVATYFSIPAPVIGNVNLGDGILLIGSWTLGLPWALSCALGAMLADLVSGYVPYAPATLIIKMGMVVVAVILRNVLKKTNLPALAQRLLSALAAEMVMVVGYFAFEAIFARFLFPSVTTASLVAPIGNLPFNLVQALIAIFLSSVLTVRRK